MCIFYKYFYSFWYPYFLWYFHTFLVLPLPDVSTLVWVFPLPDVPTRSWYFHSCLVFLHLLGVPTARCSYCLVFSLLDVPTACCFDALFSLPNLSIQCPVFSRRPGCLHTCSAWLSQRVSMPSVSTPSLSRDAVCHMTSDARISLDNHMTRPSQMLQLYDCHYASLTRALLCYSCHKKSTFRTSWGTAAAPTIYNGVSHW